MIVKTARGLTQAQGRSAVTSHGATVRKSVPALNLQVIEVPAATADAVIAAMKKDSSIARVETDRTRRVQSMPSDTLASSQWALPKIGWDQVYGVVTPSSWARVAILDTGVDGTHLDLTGSLVSGTSVIDDSNGTTDGSGHGTWLAGIVAASTNNAEGVAGVGYDYVQVMPVKVLDASGQGQDSDIIAGVLWAADNGASVILMAFSNTGFSQSLQEAIDYAWSKNIVLVAAAGNNGSATPTFPAGDRGVIGVSATDESDNLAPFSTYGASVFLGAPGVNIFGTYPGNNYAANSGTSASAAILAGAAALVQATHPGVSNGIVVSRLAHTADAAASQAETGNGRINLQRALSDTSTDSIQPIGAAPLGNGGPFVGPYIAAAASGTIAVGAQVGPVMSGAAGSATYAITATRNGSGTVNGTYSVTTVLPAGVTASFSPATFTSTGNSAFTNSTLTLSVTAAVAANSYPFTVTLSDGPFSTTANGTLVVQPGKLTPTVTVTVGSYTFNNSPQGPDSATNTGDGSNYTFSYVGTGATTYGPSATKPTNAGTYTATATVAATANYNSASSAATAFTINKATPTVTVTVGTYTFNNSPQGPDSATNTGDGSSYSFSYIGTGATTYGPSATKPTGAGTYNATATVAATANYASASSVATPFSINKATPTVTVTVGSYTFNNSAQGPDSATNSGDGSSYTFSYIGTGATTYGPSATKPTDAGTYNATATVAATTNYAGASSPATPFSIGKATPTVTVTVGSYTFNNSPQGPDSATNSGDGSSYTFSYIGTGATTYGPSATKPTDAGTYNATATVAATSNYASASSAATPFSIQKATPTVTVTVGTYTFNSSPQGPDSATNSGDGSSYTFSYIGTGATTYGPSATKPTDAGTYNATATVAATANYASASSAATPFSIQKATPTVTVTVGSYTFNNSPQGPDSATNTGDGSSYTFSYVGTGATTYGPSATKPTGAGTYTATATVAATTNYASASSTATAFSINKATPTVTVTVGTYTFNNSPQGPDSATNTGDGSSYTFSYIGTGATTYGPSATKPTNAGTYNVTATVAATANYAGASSAATGFSIAKAVSTTLISCPASVVYAPPANTPCTASVTGVGGLNSPLLVVYANNTSVGTANAGASYGGDANHNGSSASTTFQITARPALVNYIGQTQFVTSGTSSTTAQVTLSASMQDPTGLALVGATVDFIDLNSGAVLASKVPVSPVSGSPATGTANKIVTLSTGNYGAQAYVILVKLTPNYTNADQPLPDKTAEVVVSKPAAANQISGGGTIQTNAFKAGTYGVNSTGSVTFTAGINYNKSMTNLQGQITILITQTDGTMVSIKSNSLNSMAVTNITGGKRAIVYTKASVTKYNLDGSSVGQGNVSLRMDLDDVSGTDKIGFTFLSSQDSSLIYSNHWELDTLTNAWRTILDNMLTGSAGWIG